MADTYEQAEAVVERPRFVSEVVVQRWEWVAVFSRLEPVLLRDACERPLDHVTYCVGRSGEIGMTSVNGVEVAACAEAVRSTQGSDITIAEFCRTNP